MSALSDQSPECENPSSPKYIFFKFIWVSTWTGPAAVAFLFVSNLLFSGPGIFLPLALNMRVTWTDLIHKRHRKLQSFKRKLTILVIGHTVYEHLEIKMKCPFGVCQVSVRRGGAFSYIRKGNRAAFTFRGGQQHRSAAHLDVHTRLPKKHLYSTLCTGGLRGTRISCLGHPTERQDLNQLLATYQSLDGKMNSGLTGFVTWLVVPVKIWITTSVEPYFRPWTTSPCHETCPINFQLH